MSDAEALAAVVPMDDSLLEQFCAVTGASQEIARATLEACAGDLEMAINMQMDSMIPAADEAPIIIDPLPSVSQSSSSAMASSTNHSNQASSSSYQADGDDVRPPIPPVRQVLVDDNYSYQMPRAARLPQGVFDHFRDFQAEARWREEYAQDDPEAEGSSRSTLEKRRTLEELFRPPLDLMFTGSMEAAKDEGTRENKWLMVNVQDNKEFTCQILNRDVWSNPAVKTIVSEHFVFWQVYRDSSEGQRYMQFYPFHRFPYVAILDPRTGENLRSWATITDSVTFCDLVTEFLADHPSPNGAAGTAPPVLNTIIDVANNEASSSNEAREKRIYEASEEEQLKAAIAASLQEANHKNTSVVIDEDSDDLETFDSDDEIALIASRQKKDNDGDTKPAKVEKSAAASASSEVLIVDSPSEVEDWKKYLGQSDQNFELVFRYPDGNREPTSFPSDSKLKAVFLYLSSKGYNLKEYDLVTNFPRKNVHEVAEEMNLVEAGLSAREMMFVQHKT